MAEPYLLVTGFGPFLNVPHNASGALAEALDGRAGVRGVQLPTEYGGAGARLEELVAEGRGNGLAGILSMGVHKGTELSLGSPFRIRAAVGEAGCGGGRFGTGDPGVVAQTPVDLSACMAAMGPACGERVAISEDAGGYVCDFVCGWILERGRELFDPFLVSTYPQGGTHAPWGAGTGGVGVGG